MNHIAESIGKECAANEPSVALRPRRTRWGHRLLILFLLGTLLFVFRHPLMTAAAHAWILDEKIDKSDAAVVLGGGVDTRPFFAADLYQRKIVPLVLLAEVKRGPAALLNLMPSDSDASMAVLLKQGVPESAIQRIGDGVNNTRDEAVGVREWLKGHPDTKRLIIGTDPFHTRRVRYIFQHELQELPVQLIVTSIPTKRYDPLQWWNTEQATLDFQNEIAKMIYYWLHS